MTENSSIGGFPIRCSGLSISSSGSGKIHRQARKRPLASFLLIGNGCLELKLQTKKTPPAEFPRAGLSSSAFKKIRWREESPFTQRFGSLLLAQHPQAFHGCSRSYQIYWFRQSPNLPGPRWRFLM